MTSDIGDTRVRYGNTGCGVFKTGRQNQKGFWIKINCKPRPCPFIPILSRFYPDFILILSKFYPDKIRIKFGLSEFLKTLDKIRIKSR